MDINRPLSPEAILLTDDREMEAFKCPACAKFLKARETPCSRCGQEIKWGNNMWMCVCCADSNIDAVFYFEKLEEAEKFVCIENTKGIKKLKEANHTITEEIEYRKSPFFADDDYSQYARKTEKQLYPSYFTGAKTIDKEGEKHYFRWLICGCRIYENAEEAMSYEPIE